MGDLWDPGETGASSSASLLMLLVSARLRHAGHVFLKLVRRTTNYAVKSNHHLVIRQTSDAYTNLCQKCAN
ncbi:hypothetical protein B9Z45_05595 [Limnohabitans sp. 2KL-17]|nr:hypothetical protein B9Z45_05595 [Limnohabitans sp. 2KL-17]